MRLQRTIKTLVSKESAATEARLRQTVAFGWQSSLRWGLISTFLTLFLFGVGLLFPTMVIGIISLALAWIFLVLTLLVALRDIGDRSRLVFTVMAAVLAGWGGVQIVRHPPQSEILAAIRLIPDAVYDRLAPRFNQHGVAHLDDKEERQPQTAPTTTPRQQNQGQLRLIFKDAKLFTPARKRRITDELESFYSYLAAVGFDPPRDIPPFEIRPGTTVAREQQGSLGNEYADVYDGQFMIGERRIDDSGLFVRVSADYAFSKMLLDVGLTDEEPGAFRTNVAYVLATYYLASFDNRYSYAEGHDWSNALWQIRQKYGRTFTDSVLLYTFKRLDAGGLKLTPFLDFNSFFINRFFRGERTVDNFRQKATDITEILRKNGLTE